MKPGIKTIIAGAVLFVVGALVIPLLAVLSLTLGKSHEFQFIAPGNAETTVNAPGRYYLWNNYRTVYEGKSYDRSENIPDGMEFQIRDAKGHQLQFFSDISISSSSDGSAKKSIGYVEVESPGKIEIHVTGGSDDRIFSFSQFRLLKMFGLIVGGIGISMLVGLTGIGLIIWGIVKLVSGKKMGE